MSGCMVDTVGPWSAGEQQRPALRTLRTRGADVREHLWRLIVATVGSCMRYRVTGLAAEAAFFAMLSMPPLVFALAGAIGYVCERVQRRPRSATCAGGARPVVAGAHRRAVNKIILPTIDDVLEGGRYDVISIGFVLALWSGSRALNVFVDTITIMHGLGGHRGIVKTRALSFVLYVMAMITGVISCRWWWPGPRWSSGWCRERFELPR